MLAAVLVGSAALAVGCRPSSGDQTSAHPAQSQYAVVSTLDELRFEPGVLILHAGRPVQLSIKNPGNLEHDFVIAEMPARDVKNDMGSRHNHSMKPGIIMGDAAPKQEATIGFTPTRAGTYEFYCSQPGHREAGMKGTLTVE